MTEPGSTFPPELERNIFELCARSRPKLVPKLMRVAWRVKEWVEPLLYRTITIEFTGAIDGYPVFSWDVLLSAIRSKPTSFFQNSVRNVCLVLSPRVAANVRTLLSVCTGVENLAIVMGRIDGMVPLIASLPLTRFSMYGKALFLDLPPTHPLFARITHLELGNATWFPAEHADRLALMPQLTHVSFQSSLAIHLCLGLLEKCRSLAVLIILNLDHEECRHYLPALSRDPRSVAMQNTFFVKDWEMGAHTGVDYWTRAEDFIARRRSGEIPARQYEILNDASQYIV
ncbi:hypothetical protein B0H19DRAFT_996937 [Mycena capillaripes]|nr:hypothetical protein B0H19DRAFT_996937 [Mycena capillaripes]